MISAAIRPALSRLGEMDLGPFHSGRVEITVTVRPNGRVSSVRLEAPSDLLTPAGRKRMERVVRGISFPRGGEEYDAEFPLILQGR
jgi:hypothetical protein